MYYIWSNLCVLNNLRKARGLNIITLRPHAGETGDPMHLGSTYMLCESINHGINLEHQVSLQYLYYLDQVSTFFFSARFLSAPHQSPNYDVLVFITWHPFEQNNRSGCQSARFPIISCFAKSGTVLSQNYFVAA